MKIRKHLRAGTVYNPGSGRGYSVPEVIKAAEKVIRPLRRGRPGKIGWVLKYSFMVAAFIKRSGYGDGTVMFVLTG
ncbi:hypothetical protein MGLY_24980 [Neomoorella glycerini]|uniref:Uncharacterized protein n=1 Tax=Neomoorella glycerini TaxID=55779 RepID=A0A6I5ZUP1_9FIRM|nr:hypothetical protein MGLY_24980 [Moorella glycerini]